MDQTWNILHVTDFHIEAPDGCKEVLRTRYYDEYLQGLIEQLLATGQQIDAIFATGDFIQKGNTANFSHAAKILEHLAEKLGVDRDNLVVCPGNHDISRELDAMNDIENARIAFNEFASNFGNKGLKRAGPRAGTLKLSNGIAVLTLDSTIGARGKNEPGSLDSDEVDSAMSLVKQLTLDDSGLLVVISHHPSGVDKRLDAPFDEDDPSWYAKHIWSKGEPLYDRILRLSRRPVLWLSGDIHRDWYVAAEHMHSVATGRLGTSTDAPSSQVRRQARLITISSNADGHSQLFEYVVPGHTDQVHIGRWEAKQRAPDKYSRGDTTASPVAIATTVAPPVDTRIASTTVNKTKATQAPLIEIFSPDLQKKILETIASNNLYYVGRFATNDNESSLSWVSIGEVLDNGELLLSVVTEMAKVAHQKVRPESRNDAAFIGIDSWGAIIASQLSVMTGIGNYCIAARAEGLTHTASEKISETVIQAINTKKHIILVTDVIGSGRSTRYVYDSLVRSLDHPDEANWGIFSVICDDQCPRNSRLDFASACLTACKDLRMPILNNNDLPPESILRPDISFLRAKGGCCS